MTKILVVNKYHFISGGAERYFLNVMDAMRRRGVEPIPFSVNYSRTLPTPYRKYFLEPVVKGQAAKIQNMKPTLKEQLSIAGRAIYSLEAKRAIHRVCREERPDAAYFLNFNNHISPSAIDACVEAGVPPVMRMSDFNLVCASNMYYRGGPCTACHGGLHHAVINRCVHGSLAKSLVQVAANSFHRLAGIYKKVKAFVAPTEFMAEDLVRFGVPPEKVHQINTFREVCVDETGPDLENPYILFVGRFVPYKGVYSAIRAFNKVPGKVRLRLVGDEGDEEAAKIKAFAADLNERRIDFLPFERDAKKLHALTHRALFSLVPSEMYDNLPNTILESFACGRPVIATRLGSLPGIVKEGEYGALFQLGDTGEFAAKMKFLIEKGEERERMGRNARNAIAADYSEDKHMERLFDIFEKAAQKPFRQPCRETADSAAAR